MGFDGTLKFDTSIDVSGFQEGISKIGSCASKALKATTAIIGGAATAVAGIGTAAVKTGAGFESSMSNVAAISGATGDQLKSLTNKAKEMGAKTKFSASESADAFSYMAMAGWKTEDMLTSIEGVMNLAAASGEDLATTSDIVTDAMTAFGLAADGTTNGVANATHFADILASTSANANTNVGLMGETFKYVAPVAGALGFSAEDCAKAIGLMANSGIKASQAGTSLRSFMTRMAKPTKEVSVAMETLGLSLTNSDGSMKSLNEIMLDLRSSFAGLTEDEQANMAAALGGQEAMSGLLAIINASDSDFEKLSNAITNCDGAAAQMAETMQNNLEGQITILKSGLEGLGISLYEEMQEPLKNVVKEAQKMVQDLQSVFDDGGLDALVSKTGDIMAEIVTEVAKAAPQLIETAENLVSSFIQGIMRHRRVIAGSGATMVAELVQSIMDVSGEMWSAGIELFALFLHSLTRHSEELGQSFGQMLVKIGDAVQENLPLIIQAGRDFITGFCQGLSEEFPGFSALISGFFQGFLDTAGEIVQETVDVLNEIFSAIDGQDPATMEEIGQAIGTIAASIAALNVAKSVIGSLSGLFSILNTFKGGVSGIVGVVGRAVEGFSLWAGGAGKLGEVIALEFPKLAAFGSKISGIVGVVGSALSKIGSLIGSGVSAVVKFFATFGTTIAGIGSLIGGSVLAVANFVDMFRNGFDTIKEILMGVGVALAAVGAVILGAPALVAGIVAGIVFAVANLAIAIKQHWDQILAFIQEIPAKASEIADSVISWFQSLPDRASAFFSETIEKVKEWGSNLLTSASEAANNAITSVIEFFEELPYKIGYALGTAIGEIIKFGINAVNWAKTNGPIIIDNIVQFFEELPGKIWSWLTNTYEKFVAWGTNMRQKAQETAQNAVESIITFFSELPGKVHTWLSNTLQRLVTWGTNMRDSARTAASNTISAVVDWFSKLPDRVHTWLSNTISRVAAWGNDLRNKGREAADKLVSSVLEGVQNLPSNMKQVGKNIVAGVWNGICAKAAWFLNSVKSFFSGIVDGVKDSLGIHSPSRVFADEVGKFIPPGVGEGFENAMPSLERKMDEQLKALANKAQMAVKLETGKITMDKNITQTYKVEQENGQSFDGSKTEVVIEGETHVHVDLDGEEIGHASTPIVDKDLGRIDTHKKRGG